MIQTDLTEVLKSYCKWDDVVKERYLRYAEELIQQHKVVIYKGIDYRLLEDLKVDLDFECKEQQQ
jgi:hypothetical protein